VKSETKRRIPTPFHVSPFTNAKKHNKPLHVPPSPFSLISSPSHQGTTMTPEELKALDKEVKKLKRISSEWASQLHDLVEDKLPAGYEQIPAIAQSTYDACQNWAVANAKLLAAQQESNA
jgi:hypothetical protein